MRQDVRAGYRLEISLTRSGARTAPALLAALRVGEGHGNLAEEMFAVARTLTPRAPRRLRKAVGRSVEATRFAAALARLLREEGLTEKVVASAGNVAAAGSRRFRHVVAAIVADMDSGRSFAEALSRYPRYFDPLYCGILAAADSRSRLRLCLERLGTCE
jgi:type II secretory pathway component PulF